MENPATQLVQDIKDANAVSDTFVHYEHPDHDISIWFSRVSGNWVLDVDGAVVKDAKHVETIVNTLVDMGIIYGSVD